MKNLKSVSALVLLAISFSACEKNNLPTPARPEPAKRQGQIILPIWDLRPTEIKDATGQLEKSFTYDSKNRLTYLYKVGEEMLSFEYASNGHLLRVNHFENGMVSDVKNANVFDLYSYNNPGINKPTKISRYINNAAMVEKAANTNELIKVQPNSTIEIAYDRNLNKISEKEFTFLGNGLAKGIVREHRYTYDSRNNVTNVIIYEQGVFKGEVQFKQYDSFRNILSGVPVVNLLPFQFTGTNNATMILSGNLPELKVGQTFIDPKINCGSEVQKKFEYNDYGFPVSETTITKDGSYTSFIKYNKSE